MATTVDFAQTQIISVLRADMALIQSTPVEIRELNINTLRAELKDLEASNDGMPWPDTNEHTAPKTISGVTLARVVEIKEPYTITFEDGLYNVNVIGGNSNVSDKVNKNQVGVNTANSAGLQDPFSLQAASFNGAIALDVSAGTAGTTFPIGTRQVPVSNSTDALAIAIARGLNVFDVISSMTLGSNDFSAGYTFRGNHAGIVTTVSDAAIVDQCTFANMTIQGTLDGNNTLRECVILDLADFSGFIFQCGLAGTLTLSGTNLAVIMQCFSLISGGGVGRYPKIDCGGAMVTPLAIRDYNGGIGIINCTSQTVDAQASIDMASGRCVFESTVTAGDWIIRGIAEVQDNSTGTATVVDETTHGDLHKLIDATDTVHLSVAYSGSTILMSIWLDRLGQTILTPTSCQIDWYVSSTDALLFTASDSGPDTRGNFHLSQSQVLGANTAYYCLVTVTDASGTVIERRGVPTVG